MPWREARVKTMSKNIKRWPAAGDVLVHKFRNRPGRVVARVITVDRDSGRVAVEVEGFRYLSLSAAASAIAGCRQNGWIYWGLKQQQRPIKSR